jgi:hypothetical protein
MQRCGGDAGEELFETVSADIHQRVYKRIGPRSVGLAR